jgi:dTMP kinase
MFITFEGIDFSGKTTQAKMLSDRFNAEGHPAVLVREPGNTAISESIRAMLLHGESVVNDRAELLLFEASRAQLVSEVILPVLREGSIVVCDRFFDSTYAYQGFGRRLPLEDVTRLNRFASHELLPDLTFLLHLTPEEAFVRSLSFDGPDRIEQNDIAFFERVMNGYLRAALAEPHRFHVLDAMQSQDEIHHIIWNAILEEERWHKVIEVSN